MTISPWWTYDPGEGAGYMHLIPGDSEPRVHETPIHEFPNCALVFDVAEDGRLIGIEVIS